MSVKDEVLSCFKQGELLGTKEVMEKIGRGRVVYRALTKLVEEGKLVVVKQETTTRKPRKIFGLKNLYGSSEAVPF